MKRFRGGLVFKAHVLVYHSTLGSRVINKKKRSRRKGNILAFRHCREALPRRDPPRRHVSPPNHQPQSINPKSLHPPYPHPKTPRGSSLDGPSSATRTPQTPNPKSLPSEKERLLCRNLKRCRGGLVFKAHRLVYRSSLG